MRVKIIVVVIEAGAIAKNVSSHHNKIIIQLLSKKKDSKTIHQGLVVEYSKDLEELERSRG